MPSWLSYFKKEVCLKCNSMRSYIHTYLWSRQTSSVPPALAVGKRTKGQRQQQQQRQQRSAAEDAADEHMRWFNGHGTHGNLTCSSCNTGLSFLDACLLGSPKFLRRSLHTARQSHIWS
ncbi:unnamed protein product [Ceratitis capitata]|uniref:(Mediterranean fruit fly) hypothetical protein n=1 Tax=Ceratitis capitata TaxID=7213 RepID=A0A811UND4_CERCA|nr:unnamed protein product [Ceratitis capitata]